MPMEVLTFFTSRTNIHREYQRCCSRSLDRYRTLIRLRTCAYLRKLTRAANESTHPVIHPSLGTRFSRLRFACHDALDEYLIPLSVMKVVFPYTGPTPLV